MRNETCLCDKTAASSRCKHSWISLAAGTLGSHSVPMRHVDATRLLHSHATSRLGSLSMRKETCSCEKTVATKNCCVLTRRAHLDLTPCAMRHVHATRLLRSHAARTLGSLAAGTLGSHSVPMRHAHAASTLGSLLARKETCSWEKTVAISRRPQYR